MVEEILEAGHLVRYCQMHHDPMPEHVKALAAMPVPDNLAHMRLPSRKEPAPTMAVPNLYQFWATAQVSCYITVGNCLRAWAGDISELPEQKIMYQSPKCPPIRFIMSPWSLIFDGSDDF